MLSAVALLGLIIAELLHKLCTAICRLYYKPTGFKLLRSLFKQVKAVNDEIELCYFIVLSKVIGKNIAKIVRQCGFTAALRMPYHAGLNSLRELFTDSKGSEHLLIPHNVFLIDCFDLTVNLTLHIHISDTVFENEQQSLRGTHGSDDTVRRGIDIQICLVFGRSMDNLIIKVFQYLFLDFCINSPIWVFFDEWCYIFIQRVFFTETVKRRTLFSCRTVKRTLNRHNTALGIILHVIGEDHKLSDIDKSAEFLVRETLSVHTFTLSDHTAVIIGLLDLNKH